MRSRFFLMMMVIIPALAGAQNRLPDYYTVVKKFFSLYHHDAGPEMRLRFAKKRDGWYVELTNQNTGRLASSQVFWSLQKGRYQVLENFVGANTEPVQLKISQFANGPDLYDAIHYARSIYYGYDGWDADVIKDYGKATITNDTLLEGLARAYTLYADRFFWNVYGNSVNDSLVKRLGRLELPGDDRVQTLKECIEKSAALYETIYAHNKLYQTSLGNVAVNIFVENIHGYLQMIMAERPAEAKWFLDRSRLPANDSIAAQNLLASVDPNGILFSYGSIDYYASLYLQEKYNTRKDVSIVNVSMLRLPVYLQLLKKKNVVQFQTTAESFGKTGIDILYYRPGSFQKNKMKLTDFVAGFKNWKKASVPGRDSVTVYETQTIYLSPDTISFSLGEYLTLEELITFDIIASNFGTRPFHFNDQVPGYFTQYTETAGLTSQIMAYREKTNEDYMQKLKTFLRTSYKPPFVNFTDHSAEYNTYALYHVALYSALIDESENKKDKKATDSLVNACFAPFGSETPYVRIYPGLADWLYKNKYDALADKLAATYAKVTVRLSLDPNNYMYFNKAESISNLEQLKTVLLTHKREAKFVDEAVLQLSRE